MKSYSTYKWVAILFAVSAYLISCGNTSFDNYDAEKHSNDSIGHVAQVYADSFINSQNKSGSSKGLPISSVPLNSIVKPARPPKYKIIRQGTSYCDYEILIAPVNLNELAYKGDVESILDDIATKYKTTAFTAWVYDNSQAAKLNYQDLELSESLTESETKLVNYHIVAIYGNNAGYYFISYFENIAAEDRHPYNAWSEAFNEDDFKKGYNPVIN